MFSTFVVIIFIRVFSGLQTRWHVLCKRHSTDGTQRVVLAWAPHTAVLPPLFSFHGQQCAPSLSVFSRHKCQCTELAFRCIRPSHLCSWRRSAAPGLNQSEWKQPLGVEEAAASAGQREMSLVLPNKYNKLKKEKKPLIWTK